MCGRFTSLLTPELLAIMYEALAQYDITPRYNIAPTQNVPVVRQSSAGDRYLSSIRWGLVPHWAKDQTRGSTMINARSETVAEKPAFRQAIRSRRCIVPASGYFEWKSTPAGKLPHYITTRDGSLFSLAGIWESWKTSEGGNLETFSLLTTAANSVMLPIHDRMPVILRPDAFSLWLDCSVNNPRDLEYLYQPFPGDQMQSWQVSKLVNSPAHDSDKCIRPLSEETSLLPLLLV
jgi:putative SOS response-associated peptidase YedK